MSWLEAPVAGFGLVYLFIKVDFWNKKMQFYFDVDTLHTSQNSFNKWTKISSLEITSF